MKNSVCYFGYIDYSKSLYKYVLEPTCLALRNLILRDEDASPQILKGIRTCYNDIKTRTAIAKHRNTPYDVFQELSKDPNDQVKMQLVVNPHCDSSILSALKGDSNKIIGIAASCRIITGSKILKKYSNSKIPAIRKAIAMNYATDQETISKLCTDSNRTIRQIATARSRNSSAVAQRKLLNSNNWYIRALLASNPFTIESILLKLSLDGDFYARASICRNPRAPQLALEHLLNVPLFMLTIASNLNCPPEILDLMSSGRLKSAHAGLNQLIIKNAAITRDYLKRGTGDN